MGHSVKGHNGILLPSMLIFTAWAVLLFFLISVNFRICLSSRLTPFLEVPWNLKNKTNNYHWKKADAPEVQGKRHMRGCAWQGAGGATGPSWSLCSLPRRGKCPPVSEGPGGGSGTQPSQCRSITVELDTIWKFCIYWLQLSEPRGTSITTVDFLQES